MILAKHLQNTTPWLSELGRFFDTTFQRPNPAAENFRFLADDGGWTLELDLPGVPREAVTLESKDRELKLSVDHEGPFPAKLSWRLPLTRQTDAAAVTASLTDGVLSIRLPKLESVQETSRIEIL